MPDINAERLEEIINVPECAEADEVRDLARLLTEAQDMLTVRNHQNRTLYSLTNEADILIEVSERKHNRLQQIVIGTFIGGAALLVLVWFIRQA